MYIFKGASYGVLLQSALTTIVNDGVARDPRGMPTIEIQQATLQLEDPSARYPRLPHRNANIFALVAETAWVLAGRADLAFIVNYLPRMSHYSQDGSTLAGAYGPRIRNWGGLDQINRVLDLLGKDPHSRRAVISLFDPARDYDTESLDVPCCNQLQFMINRGRLDLTVYSRSMDIMWGSAINVFEWTTLQEALANWLDVPMGEYFHHVGSLHLYQEFLPRATRIIESQEERPEQPMRFDIPYKDFDVALESYFNIESRYRAGEVGRIEPDVQYSWLEEALSLTRSYWAAKNYSDFSLARSILAKLESSQASEMARSHLDYMESARG